MNTSESRSCIVITSRLQWIANPQLGRIAVFIDGSLIGRVIPQGEIKFECDPGPHRVRVRRSWFMSPEVTLNPSPGELVRMDANLPSDSSVVKRLWRLTIHPFTSMSLEQTN